VLAVVKLSKNVLENAKKLSQSSINVLEKGKLKKIIFLSFITLKNT